MFACSTYQLTEVFEENISREIEDNVRRIRHHACLGLWCGNNEMEGMIVEGYTKTRNFWRLYQNVQLCDSKIVKRERCGYFLWPSSPSSGGNFMDSQDETRRFHYCKHGTDTNPLH